MNARYAQWKYNRSHHNELNIIINQHINIVFEFGIQHIFDTLFFNAQLLLCVTVFDLIKVTAIIIIAIPHI